MKMACLRRSTVRWPRYRGRRTCADSDKGSAAAMPMRNI
jgi:hypothetical protein